MGPSQPKWKDTPGWTRLSGEVTITVKGAGDGTSSALFDAGPSAFSVEALDLLDGPEDRAYGSAMYGDFPHGADLRLAVLGGFGLQALEEADMRAQAWQQLADQAAVTALALGRATYREVGEVLGISTAAAHKRYAKFLKPDVWPDDAPATP